MRHYDTFMVSRLDLGRDQVKMGGLKTRKGARACGW